MKTKIVNFSGFSKASWKVERYLGELESPHDNFKYPLLQIREVAHVRGELIDPKKKTIKDLKYIGLENIQSLTGELIQGDDHKEILSISKRFYKNDILYSRLRPYLNKVYLTAKPIEEGICSNEFIVLVCNEKILPLFLRTILTSSILLNKISSMQAGAALPRIGATDLLNIYIPVPPIEIQKELIKNIVNSMERYRAAAELVKVLPREAIESFTEALQG